MKKVVRVTYFQPNGRFFKEDTLFIPAKISVGEAMLDEIPALIEEPDMFMYMEDAGDGVEPFLMPHLFKPGAKKKAEERKSRADKKAKE